MMRFDTKKRRTVRNYSTRREQLRLLALFVPLALVILAMVRLRDPKTAAAINAFFAPPEQQAPTKPRPPVAEQVSFRRPVPFPGVDTELLKTIEDNTYFRNAETAAWFHFFELLQKTDVDPTQATNVEYVQLVDQPDVYRGKLVTVRGAVRRITKEKPAENGLGITSYYRAVIQPADGTNFPIVVYCLELPAGVAPGDGLSLDVNMTGLFFKNLSERWGDGLGIAPVILANSLLSVADEAAAITESKESVAEPVSSVPATPEVSFDVGSEDGQEAFRKILTLDGWDAKRLASFDEGEFLSAPQRIEALELLRRLRTVDSVSLEDWAEFPSDSVFTNVDHLRGKLFLLIGRVTNVIKRATPAPDAERLEMREYFQCEFDLEYGTGPVTLIAARVPKDWLKRKALDEPARAAALFVKRLGDETSPRTLWLAKEVAWFPGAGDVHWDSDEFFRDAPDPRLGKTVLGAIGVDVGLLDMVKSRGRIRAEESAAFYQMLSSVVSVEPSKLVRIAQGQLPLVIEEWKGRLASGGGDRDKALAREVLDRAGEGRYSVAMLFNDPEPQIGRLFVFDGVARRATRVEVGGKPAGGSMDVSHRYAIEHYYELEVFTDDSQNYPLVFCVWELPQGFPIGANIHVPVRIAGFFFKDWLYNTRGGPQASEGDDKSAGPRAQYAPLLIGHAPIMLPAEQGGSSAGRYVLGGLFVLGLIGIWAAAAWFARDERRFRERTRAATYELPSGQNLDDLNVPEIKLPMKE